LSLGLQTVEEVIDVTGAVESSTTSVPAFAPANSKALEDALMANHATFVKPTAPVMHDEDGVVIEPQGSEQAVTPAADREPGEDDR
jgi:hypothetical protein